MKNIIKANVTELEEKIIIKKKYKNKGEKIIEFKHNFNELFKKYVPKNNPEGNNIQSKVKIIIHIN